MRRGALSTGLIAYALLSVAPAASQDSTAIDQLSEESCAGLLPDPEAVLVTLAPDLVETAAFSLTLEAVVRQCAALGVFTIGEVDDQDGTRAAGPARADEEQEIRLRREARYYLETAMQIDPDASKDLLRRLLGSGPRPAE